MNILKHSIGVMPSPWLDDTKSNGFRDQFRLIEDLKIDTWLKDMGANFTPIEIYQWIHDNKGMDIFFAQLAKFAPMFPLISYKEQVSVWLSTPPSGMGNAVYIVMGYDSKGQLRAVGGNYFTEPKKRTGPTLNSSAFFKEFDLAGERMQFELVKDAVEKSISAVDAKLLWDIRTKCEQFNTMAFYITVLTESGSFFHSAPAVIDGEKPADLSFEFFGEFR